MTTIAEEIHIQGNTLMKNFDCKVKIKPSDAGSIRIFVKNDKEYFDACLENVISTEHYVTLGSRLYRTLLGGYKYKAGLCEHFMAACAVLEINSLDVYLSEEEFPVLDGSAKEWIRLFRSAGIVNKPQKRTYYTVSEPVYYLNKNTSLVILPDDGLYITYAVNYNHKDLKNRKVSFDGSNINEIIEARTFGFYKDLKKFQLLGIAKGVTIDNTVGLTDEGYTVELRSELEPVKHKILDLIGDIYQTGVSPFDLKCRIIAQEAGHTVHIKTAKLLKEKLIEVKK